MSSAGFFRGLQRATRPAGGFAAMAVAHAWAFWSDLTFFHMEGLDPVVGAKSEVWLDE
ncbi:MAG: hypothetical protein M0036_10665 [Desulfobacteraceae bacterium]|nr:hypothetical protein [Desulfobacteraceae bacterium]